jgi:HEXXH motif-containing protein
MMGAPVPFFAPATDPDDPALAAFGERCAHSLRSTLRSLRGHLGREADETIETVTTLCDIMGDVPLRRALWSPYYRHWRTRLTALTATGQRAEIAGWLAQLPRLLFVPAAQVAESLPAVRVPLFRPAASASGRELRLPGVPRHMMLPGSEQELATLCGQAGRLLIDLGGRITEGPLDALLAGGEGYVEHARLGGTRTELDAGDPWLRGWLAQFNAADSPPPYPRRDLAPAVDLTAHRPVFDAAARLIAGAWPDCLEELSLHIRVVVPFWSRLMLGWTTLTQLGALYVRAVTDERVDLIGTATKADPVLFTAETLVHEAAHTRLYVMSADTPLHALDHDVLRPSPFRKDPRPVIGLYHAAFVLTRIVVFMYAAAGLTGDEQYARRAEENHRDLRQALDALAGARLTPAGRDLLEESVARTEPQTVHVMSKEGVR